MNPHTEPRDSFNTQRPGDAKFGGRVVVIIEVATQSAGLSSAMAGTYWSPEAAIPGAIAAVWHNISGALFAFPMRRFAKN